MCSPRGWYRPELGPHSEGGAVPLRREKVFTRQKIVISGTCEEPFPNGPRTILACNSRASRNLSETMHQVQLSLSMHDIYVCVILIVVLF